MNETSKRKLDLFKIAHQNARRIENQFKVIKNNYRDEEKVVLETFLDFVEKSWCISINLKQSEVTGFLISGKYKNMYQVIEEDLKELRGERGINISKEEAAKNRMGFFYEKRKIFENQFKDSDRFIYAAFNIGGLGLKKYGDFSLIIHQKKVERLSSCVFLKKESIGYVENNGLNTAQLKKDTADRETVHFLATIKNEEKIRVTIAKEWPKIVCSENDYIEAVTADEISPGHIDTLRVNKEAYDMYFDYLYKAYGSQLDESEKRYLREFKNILQLLEKNGLDKEITDDNSN
jgi:hypothetical protein